MERRPSQVISARAPMSGMREMLGPLGVDQAVRGAINTCWQLLPPEDRTVERLEGEIMRIVRRVLEDVREDAGAFGFTGEGAEGEGDASS